MIFPISIRGNVSIDNIIHTYDIHTCLIIIIEVELVAKVVKLFSYEFLFEFGHAKVLIQFQFLAIFNTGN